MTLGAAHVAKMAKEFKAFERVIIGARSSDGDVLRFNRGLVNRGLARRRLFEVTV